MLNFVYGFLVGFVSCALLVIMAIAFAIRES